MHEQHRERVRERFLREGLDGFPAHNVLELLLFYSIPRRDTNEIAHRLIDRFGSVSAVFDADYSELQKVTGIGENSAVLIKMIPQLARRYMTERELEKTRFDTAEKIGKYFSAQFLGETVEAVSMMTLTSSYDLISCDILYKGSVNSSKLETRAVIEKALYDRASMVVIAHNHPGGDSVPSGEDIVTTRLIEKYLALIDVTLLEHFVIAGNSYTPIMYSAALLPECDTELRQSRTASEIKRFYGNKR